MVQERDRMFRGLEAIDWLEPVRCFEVAEVRWSKLSDMCVTADNKLLAGSTREAMVAAYHPNPITLTLTPTPTLALTPTPALSPSPNPIMTTL